MAEESKTLREFRLEKLARLRERGIDPYPVASPEGRKPTAEITGAFEQYEDKEVAVAGRVTALRTHGKASFADIADDSGRIQLYFKADLLGDDYELFPLLDLGDFVGARGKVFRTRTGEVTIAVEALDVLAKGVRTPPVVKTEKTDEGEVVHDEFADPEKRYRKRYVDMMVNPAAREAVRTHARVMRAARRYLEGQGYVEIETPILQPLYGGANARPFTTYHRDLEMDLYLRIADELYLKRLLVAGFERVFEIGKDFRNESIDRTHYPEFTMLEAYGAYGDYRTMMELTEGFILAAAEEICGTLKLSYQGKDLDLSPPWPRVPLVATLNERLGLDVLSAPEGELSAALEKAGGEPAEGASRAKLVDQLFDAVAVPEMWNPTFVVDYPAELSPLAKRQRENPVLAERFELFIAGMEIANAFSEQNDPEVQRRAFEDQARARAAGDDEAQQLDEDFLEALEYGMPPAGGLGVGLDRVAMLLADAPNIREVIAFPQLRIKE
ncbi:MAG: lysine--tRNA ligase [Candidatus Zixiibacteriota bacterium]|jgi:lysyl-tRNA synthetase class 2